jgi:hypothetical protein
VGDAVPEEGGEEEGAQRDGRAVQAEHAGRDGQLVAERLRKDIAIPAANSVMAKYVRSRSAQLYMRPDDLCRIAVNLTCVNLAKESKKLLVTRNKLKPFLYTHGDSARG